MRTMRITIHNIERYIATTLRGVRLVSEDKELVGFDLSGMHEAEQARAGAVLLTTLLRALREKNKEITRRAN